jgi:lysozyme
MADLKSFENTPLMKMLIRDEGFHNRMYTCPRGKLTIGVGFNLEANGLCDQAIFVQLRHDIAKSQGSAEKVVGPVWGEIDEVRQDVLTSMVFQMGAGGFAKFTDTLAAVREKKWAEAADHMLNSRWAKQTGKRARRLAEMMRTGAYVR